MIVRESRRPLKKEDGYCLAPSKGKPGLIVLSKGLCLSKQIETFLHEAEHLQYWFLDEDVVWQAAAEKTEALEQLGLL